MTPHTVTAAAGRPRRRFTRAVAHKLSDRVHATADDQARGLGWEIAKTPGRFGLTGRRYHDPRFATRTSPQPGTTRTR